MEKAINEVVEHINTLFKKAPKNDSVQGKRFVHINVNGTDMFQTCGSNMIKAIHSIRRPYVSYDQDAWLKIILNALVDKGHIQEIARENGHGLCIQA